MGALMELAAAGAIIAGSVWMALVGDRGFQAGACGRLEGDLAAIVGQDLALGQAQAALCDHLQDPAPPRPLVLAVHGPPGVGKSFLHHLLAKALYNATMGFGECPGYACPGYKVLFGMDYLADEEAQQAAFLQGQLVQHLRRHPQALVVVEEYDKLDCHARGLVKQLLDKGVGEAGGAGAGGGLGRAVVVLESNTGYLDLYKLLQRRGGRDRLAPEEAQRALKDAVFERYTRDGCEAREDTLKLLSLVGMFLPFLPLEREHLAQILAQSLGPRLSQLIEGELGEAALEGVGVRVAPEVPGWLAGKAEYDGRFALEGAKEVPTILARHVSRPARRFLRANQSALNATASRRPPALALALAADGQGVEVRWDDTDGGQGEAAAGGGGGEALEAGAGGHGEL